MFLQQHGMKVAAAIVALSALLNGAAYVMLPGELTMQIKLDGSPGTTLPTPLGLLLIFALTALMGWRIAKGTSARDKQTGLIIALVLLALNAVTIYWNL